MWRILSLCLFLFASGGINAQTVIDRAEITEHGAFKARLIDRVPRPTDPSGYANTLTGHELTDRTDQICARLGVRFGITLRLDGKPTGTSVMLDIVNRYPPQGVTNAKGQTFEKSRYPWRATIGQPTTIVFTFDEAWEMENGTWTYEVEYNGRKIAEQIFKVMTTCEVS
jgi:Domain of unknown function (DUF3859)